MSGLLFPSWALPFAFQQCGCFGLWKVFAIVLAWWWCSISVSLHWMGSFAKAEQVVHRHQFCYLLIAKTAECVSCSKMSSLFTVKLWKNLLVLPGKPGNAESALEDCPGDSGSDTVRLQTCVKAEPGFESRSSSRLVVLDGICHQSSPELVFEGPWV